MPKRTKKVSYVVGMTLDQKPVEVTHVVMEEKAEQQETPYTERGKKGKQKRTAHSRMQQGVKRVCGQAQRDARSRRKEKKQ